LHVLHGACSRDWFVIFPADCFRRFSNPVCRFAIAGHLDSLRLLLVLGGEQLDLLALTRNGANALQLARDQGHDEAAALLEAAVKAVAEARQEELLAVSIKECG
jgi:hypothetical protein